MTFTNCSWCLVKMKVKDNFDEMTQTAYCSRGCRDADGLFAANFSDEAIHIRMHYIELTTKGKDDAP